MYAHVLGLDSYAAVPRPTGSSLMPLRRPNQAQGRPVEWGASLNARRLKIAPETNDGTPARWQDQVGGAAWAQRHKGGARRAQDCRGTNAVRFEHFPFALSLSKGSCPAWSLLWPSRRAKWLLGTVRKLLSFWVNNMLACCFTFRFVLFKKNSGNVSVIWS